MSSEASSLWTELPKARWSSMRRVRAGRDRARALLDPGAPEIDDLLRRLGGVVPGQALAHHQRHRILERRIGAVGDLGIIAAVVAVVQHGREIAGDALHAPGADRFDARLLDRVETARAPPGLGQQAAVDVAVVAGEPQRHGIGVAAHDRGFARRRACAAARAAAPWRPRRAGSGSAARARRSLRARASRAIARMQPATARLNGSCGASTFALARLAVATRWTVHSRSARRSRCDHVSAQRR